MEQELPVALSDLLPALAREIDGPRQAILAAEHHLTAVLQSRPAADGAAQDLQSIDLALQILNDLEGFMMRLGDHVPTDVQIDAGPAFHALKLERVAASLGAALGRQGLACTPQPPVELF
ncbi:hypothetical protein [Rubellimicrobium rubrum]|nr:hypothetical protein [Rubellimicrobium rubrum]